MSPEFNVFTSIRSDQSDKERFYLLPLHRDRLVQACDAFDRDSKAIGGEVGLDRLEQRLQVELIEFTGSDTGEAPVKVSGFNA